MYRYAKMHEKWHVKRIVKNDIRIHAKRTWCRYTIAEVVNNSSVLMHVIYGIEGRDWRWTE